MRGPGGASAADREGSAHVEVKTLIERLVQTEAELFAATGGAVDSVILPEGQSYLLRQAQDALLGSEALLNAILENAPDFIVFLGLDWRIRYMNRAVPGIVRGDEVGMDWFSVVLAEHRAEMRRIVETVVATGEAQTFLGHGVAEASRTAYYSRRFAPVHMGGKLLGVVLVARDITEQKESEARIMLSDRMASVGVLAAGVAHEINNPLSAVISNLELAAQDLKILEAQTTIPSELRGEIEDARSAADRVRLIVRDLRIFSRAEEDKPEPVDVKRVLESTLRMAFNEIRHRARLIKDYSPVPLVAANESRLGQVFLNLVINAAQAIPEGNAEENSIRVATSTDAVGRAVIRISDTGHGIPAEVQPRLFTPFVTTKPAGSGTGLGLSICQRIINGLGGEISFKSEVGKGTEFQVVLPASRLESASAIRDATAAVPALRRGRVLVIDDDALVGRAAGRILAAEHDITVVEKATLALEMFRGGDRFDVVLCDLMMPQMTGMDLHAALHELDPAQASRVIFVTGGAFTPSARVFIDSVTNHRLEKPIDVQELRAIVNGLVREQTIQGAGASKIG
jgi:PAS domain S-box-containing protein